MGIVQIFGGKLTIPIPVRASDAGKDPLVIFKLIKGRERMEGDPARIRTGDPVGASFNRETSEFRGDALFRAVFGEGALLASNLEKGSRYWSPNIELQRATKMCTIDQFKRLLVLAPKEWVLSRIPGGGKLIIDEAIKNAQKKGIAEQEIGGAVMTGVSFSTWQGISKLLEKKIYFRGAWSNFQANSLRHYYQDYLGWGNWCNYIGAGFAE